MKKNEKIDFEGENDEQIKQSIITRERKEFVIIYEFLEHQKNKRMFVEKKKKLQSNHISFNINRRCKLLQANSTIKQDRRSTKETKG